MSINRLILVLFIGILLSCEQNSKDPKIVFPDNADEKTETYVTSHKYTVIVQIDNGDCVMCSANNLIQWKWHEKTLNRYNIGVLIVLPVADEQKGVELLKSLNAQFHIVFDKMKQFKVINDKVFRVARDGVFVIDKDKNVIFTGSPIATEEKWDAFINLVKKN